MEQQQQKSITTSIKKPINPIFAYLSFVRRTVLTKKSLIICFSVFSVLAIIFGIAPAISFNAIGLDDLSNIATGGQDSSSNFNIWKSTTSMMLIMQCTVFAFCAAIVGVLVFLTMFKDGESDGTELITVSKPITRFQILLSRFIFALVLAIAMALINVILAAIDYGITSSICSTSIPYINTSINYMENFLYPKFGTQPGPGYFGGIFGGTILAFFTFGLIASSISNVAGGKATRIVTLLIMFLSFIIVSVGSSMLPALVQNPVVANVNKEAKNLLNSTVSNNYNRKSLDEINKMYGVQIFTTYSSPSYSYSTSDTSNSEYSSRYYPSESYPSNGYPGSGSYPSYPGYPGGYPPSNGYPGNGSYPSYPHLNPDDIPSGFPGSGVIPPGLVPPNGYPGSGHGVNPQDIDVLKFYPYSYNRTLADMYIKSINWQSYNNDIYGFKYGSSSDSNTLEASFDYISVTICDRFGKPVKSPNGADAWSLKGFLNQNGLVFNAYVAKKVGESSASGATALSYLNPASALVGMMTQNLSSSSPFGNGIPYNWAVTKMFPSPNGITIVDHSVADPNWGLMLVYVAFCGILGALTTVGYLRKDFK